MDADIHHVSDTALMVAAARALESARPGGLISDPYAEKLAGDRGMAIVQSAQEWMRMGITMRTHILDNLIREIIAEQGIATVVNLGAGLDTRPWRMDLANSLKWIEVDFEPILNYKLQALANEKPKCIHQHLYADLVNPKDRERVYAAVGSEAALMITEGLLMYLPAGAVSGLASEAPLRSGINRWLFDIASQQLMRVAHSQNLEQIESVRAEGHLTGIEIVNAVCETGWRLIRHESYVQSAKLMVGKMGPPPPDVRNLEPLEDDPSGIYLFGCYEV